MCEVVIRGRRKRIGVLCSVGKVLSGNHSKWTRADYLLCPAACDSLSGLIRFFSSPLRFAFSFLGGVVGGPAEATP